jgi:pyruvate/2-oxoglutarate dehydrogenase complex dihydrolipoamide acyltransferase (E2) component
MTRVCDHRVVAGADAARFLERLSELTADPAK